MAQQRYTSNHILIQGCPIHQNHVHVSSMTCFPQTHSLDPLGLSSRRESDLLFTSSSGNGNSNTETKNNTTRKLNHIRTTKYLIPPGYRVTSPKHWKLSWMWHNCNDWSFQDTITRKLVQKRNCLFHSAALPINPFAHTAKPWSNPRRCRVNLELKWNQLFSQPMQISVGS